MKSKQRLAQVVALALVLGFSGTYGVMADGEKGGLPGDEIQMDGGSRTIKENTVKGAWLKNKSTLNADNIIFKDAPSNRDGKGEVAVDGGSILNMTGGAINVADGYFTVEEGSTANITKAEVTSGAFANNASITMTDSTISGGTLYAGNVWEEDAPLPSEKADGQPGKLQVNGGTVNVALIWGQASVKGNASNAGGVYFGKDAEVTVKGTKGLKLPDGKVLTGIYATEHGTVKFDGAKKADISEIHADDNSIVEFSKVEDVTTGDVYVSNGGAVNFNGTDVAADTVKADAGTVSLKHSTGTFGNVELTQGASLTADSEAGVTADTLNVQGGARAIAENGGTLDIANAMNITNGGSASVADGGTLNAKSVQVSGNKSTFVQQGKSSNAAVSSLAINQGGTASITGGAEAKVDNLTIQNASLDLGNGRNKLTVAKSLVSNKGLVRTANGDNKVVLTDGAKKTGDVTVQGEGKDYNSDALAGDSSKVKTLAEVVTTADGKTAASTVCGSEGVINGASVYKVENTADGIKVTESYIPENETNRAITDLAALSLITWRQENNDLNKRLGEIRDSKGDDGVWARMARGEATFKGVKNQYNYYQMGYDKKLNDNWILGGAFSYTDGDNTFHRGTGQTKNSSFAVYGSNLRDDGSFIDLIAKYAHLKNEYDTPLGIGSGDYSTNGFSFSGEYGKRFHMDKFWLEPQVELTWGHVDSVNYSTENGARVHQNGMDSFVGRLGFSLGKDFSHGNVYARASYLYDFDGDVKASMTNGTVSREYREDIGGGWFEFGVGTNLNLGSDTHFYFDLERAEGGSGNVKTPWQWNVGVRYSF